ncbi:MAG: acyltransferase [Erysipelotrichales bacterium]|nr:MAG: acyltransferase [Erysipelotrichales bacterium]
MMGDKRNLYGIDLMKFIAAMLVVAGHVRPFLSFSLTLDVFVIHVLARVTIQFFFMTAGFLLFRKIEFPLRGNKQNNKIIFNYCKRVLVLYAIWMTIYVGVALTYFVSKVGYSPYGFYLFYRFLQGASHLWYLSALIIAVVLVYWTLRYISFKKTLVLGFVLYIVGLFGDAYYGIAHSIGIGAPVKAYLDLFATSRNGVFFGFFFVAMGAYFAKSGFRIKNPFPPFIVCMVLLTVEVFMLRAYSEPLNFNLLFFALPASVCLFSGMLEIKLKERRIYRWLRDGSLIVYLVHPLFIMLLPIGLSSLGIRWLYSNSLMQYLLVAGGSYIIAWVLIYATKKWPGLHIFY